MRALMLLAVLVLLAPVVSAENRTEIDIDVKETREPPQESVQGSTATGVLFGLDAVTLIIILAVGLVVVALVAALAGRDRYR